MARIRTISPGFFTDGELCQLSPLHRLFFAGLWGHADRAGVLEYKPRELKVQILPYDECDAEAVLSDLAKVGFIVIYSVEERSYIHIKNFAKHQRFHKEEKPRGFPGPPPQQLLRQPQQLLHPPQGGAATTSAAFTSASNVLVSDVLVSDVLVSGAGDTCPADAVTIPDLQLHRAVQQPPPPPQTITPALVDDLAAAFRATRGHTYRVTPADEMALRGISTETPREILRRWGIALRREVYPRCDTIRDLVRHWNSYATSPSSKPGTTPAQKAMRPIRDGESEADYERELDAWKLAQAAAKRTGHG